jgi:ferredoxin--NADP+ reductase
MSTEPVIRGFDTMSRLHDYDVSQKFEAKVLETARITPEDSADEVRHIVVEVSDPEFKPEVGNSFGVLVPGPHEFGNPYHFRLYSVAGLEPADEPGVTHVIMCVRRCFYVDDFSGEERPGIASNFLCDKQVGDTFEVTGPYPIAFRMPDDPTANILMVGMGTGIAPFRAFVKHIYDVKSGWEGKVRLFYGAKRGVELLYMNDLKGDLTNYYDEDTFKAFEAISPRPAIDAPVSLEETLEQNTTEVWEMLQDPNTYVFVAGLEAAAEMFDRAVVKMAGSEDKWQRIKDHLIFTKRWAELIY